MNILHLSNPVCMPVRGYGGTERVVYSLAKQQASHGHNVMVMAGSPSAIPGATDVSFCLGQSYTERRFLIKRFFSSYTMKAIAKSAYLKPDIIHNHISEEAIPLSRLMNTPVLTTLHCAISIRRFWPFITTSLSAFLPKKTKLITISKRAFDSYRPFYRAALLGFIHNGFDISAIPYNQTPKKEHEIELCFLAKLIQEKYPHVAIEVADILHERGYDVRLTLMGKLDSALSSYERDLINMVRNRPHVRLLPNLSTKEVFQILGNSSALISTSFEIGLITAQVESLATGTPVIGFSRGSAAEIVSSGKNGFLAKDKYDMAQKVIVALDLKRQDCRRFAEEHFSESRMYDEYMATYERMLYN